MSNALSLFDGLAAQAGLSTDGFLSTIKATVFPNKGNGATNEQLAAFLMVAKQYNLNPLTKEIFAFPANGGIQPVVSIDGWMKLINSHPDFDGMTFADVLEGDKVVSITCKIYRKDRSQPIEATEYMAECKRDTQVWKQWPRRMLRHKAAIQAARYAFGFAGIADPDEAERSQVIEATAIEETIVPQGLLDAAEKYASHGMESYGAYWKQITVEERKLLKNHHDGFKSQAKQVDEN